MLVSCASSAGRALRWRHGGARASPSASASSAASCLPLRREDKVLDGLEFIEADAIPERKLSGHRVDVVAPVPVDLGIARAHLYRKHVVVSHPVHLPSPASCTTCASARSSSSSTSCLLWRRRDLGRGKGLRSGEERLLRGGRRRGSLAAV